MSDIPPIALEYFLSLDGIEPKGTGNERTVSCFNPNHDDKTPSMSINVGKGVFHCHGCGISGNVITYLEKFARKTMTGPEIRKALEDRGWSGAQIEAAHRGRREAKAQAEDIPLWVERPYGELPGGLKAIARYDYVDADGRLVCRRIRYSGRPGADRDGNIVKPRKELRPWTPVPSGGWRFCAPYNERLPENERLCEMMPIYRLPRVAEVVAFNAMKADKDKVKIIIVEGEKCADAIASIPDQPDRFPVAATSFFNPKSVKRSDVSILYGQKLMLIADRDKGSRRAVVEMGKHFTNRGCDCVYVLPGADTDADDGYDVADVLSADNSWQGFKNWLQEVGIRKHRQVAGAGEELPHLGDMQDTEYFTVLGTYGDKFAIKIKENHHIYLLAGPSLATEGVMLMLAPRGWWTDQATDGRLTTEQRNNFADHIIRAAYQQGVADLTNRVFRLGAVRDGDAIIYNLGDQLLVGDIDDDRLEKTVPLDAKVDADGIFEQGRRIVLGDDARARETGKRLHDSLLDYRFFSENDARAFMGWAVISLVGGALPFRPMIWLTAPPQTGKTFLIHDVLKRFLGDLLFDIARPTEAGIAENMGSDSLPVWVDEFEPEEGRNANRMQDILGLARTATSAGMARARGSTGSGPTKPRPRFSMAVSSVERPHLSGADESRFIHIRLSRTPVEDWPSVRDRIKAVVDDKRAMAGLVSAVIRATPLLCRRAQAIEDEAIRERSEGTRRAQIIGALTAGVEFLSGDFTPIDWETIVQEDTYVPLDYIMGILVRSESGMAITIAEALRAGYFSAETGDFIHEDDGRNKEMVKLAARHGFVMENALELMIAPTATAFRQMLRNTPYAHRNMTEYLDDLPETYRAQTDSGFNRRINCGGTYRNAITIPEAVLQEVGFAR